jgi:hypothetical protein
MAKLREARAIPHEFTPPDGTQAEGSGILTFATSIREGWKASRAEIESDVTIGEVSCLKPAQLLRHLLRADGL